MGEVLATVAGSFAVLLVAFRLLDLSRPMHKRMPLLRAQFATDAAYWAFTAIATRHATRIVVILSLVPVALAIHGRVDGSLIEAGYGPASRLPLWLQAILILVMGDFIGYWMHRLFHEGRLWRFHAIHHSPVALDWLASVRVHPVNDAVMRVAGVVPLVAVGFAPLAVASAVPVLTVFAILVHANLDWDWGPLRVAVVSPRFHRWHHTSEAEGRDKNFAGLFPLWDIMFGTYYMPPGRVPEAFGTETPVPSGLLRQLAHPFRRAP